MSLISPEYNYKDVASTHEAINDIMDGAAHLDERTGMVLEFDDQFVGARGKEPVGSLKAVSTGRSDGSVTLYRKQNPNAWAVANSSADVYSDLTDEEEGVILPGMDTNKPTPKKNTASLIPNANAYLDANLNVLMISRHGVGKTATLMELAKERGLKMKYYSCSTLDPFTDLVGVPTPRFYCPKDKSYHKDTETCPTCGGPTIESLQMIRPRDLDEAEIIFFDEFNRADAKTQNALFEIIQFKTINGEPLPNLLSCWAAINPPDDDQNYQVEPLDPALLDRFDLYIKIDPKPNVAYMAQHMPLPIAKVLKIWWDQHQDAINHGTKDAHSDYISPRRLEKVGLVWCATHNTRDTMASLPPDGNYEKRKLIDQLKGVQRQIDADSGVNTDVDEDEEVTPDGTAMGDRPASQFVYKQASLKLQQDEVVKYLEDNPLHFPTHEAVASALHDGVGGEHLVTKYGKLLNALHASILEGFVASFPTAKVNQMHNGFIKLHQDHPQEAKGYTKLYNVLSKTANSANWPSL